MPTKAAKVDAVPLNDAELRWLFNLVRGVQLTDLVKEEAATVTALRLKLGAVHSETTRTRVTLCA